MFLFPCTVRVPFVSLTVVFLLIPIRNHDDRHVPHPLEMGPKEPGDPHPDRREAAGAPGHTGRTPDMKDWSLIDYD